MRYTQSRLGILSLTLSGLAGLIYLVMVVIADSAFITSALENISLLAIAILLVISVPVAIISLVKEKNKAYGIISLCLSIFACLFVFSAVLLSIFMKGI